LPSIGDIQPQDAAVCIQLEPPISGKDWACLNNRNMFPTPNGAVYIEPCPYMSEVIQDAYLSKKVCTISWEFVDLHGYAMIAAIECR
jgi:hypothetical protein